METKLKNVKKRAGGVDRWLNRRSQTLWFKLDLRTKSKKNKNMNTECLEVVVKQGRIMHVYLFFGCLI